MVGKSLSTNFVCSVLKEQHLIDDTIIQEIMLHEQAYVALFQKQEGANGSSQITGVDVISAMGLQSTQQDDQVLSEEFIMRTLATHWKLPFLRIDVKNLDPVMVRAHLPQSVAIKYLTIPVSVSDNTLVVAIVNPLNVESLEAIKKATPLKIHLAISTKTDIMKAVKKCYEVRPGGQLAEEEDLEDETSRKFEDFFTLDADEYTDQHVVDAVNLLVHYAVEQRTSEIHLKPKQDHSIIQFLIDGVLYDVKRIPSEVHENILHRLKSLAGIKHSERHVPQEGRTQFKFEDRVLRLSICTIPVVFGEKLVLRLLDPLQLFRHIYDIGFSSEEQQQYSNFLSRSHGLVLMSGPSGSGKTSTMYSTLHHLYERGHPATTIENPIESMHENFNQIAVHQSIGVTFEIAIQHVMKQAPMVLMVEVSHNRETIEQTIRATLRGHLVFTAFQAADALAALVDLLNMGIPGFLIESTLIAIVAQRLLRKVCEKCAESYQLEEQELEFLQISEQEAENLSFRKGAGCIACRGTGYSGQTAIFEIMEMTEELKALIHTGAGPHVLQQAALKAGMRPLRESAIAKMKAGITSCEEVLRVTGGLRGAIPHIFRSKATVDST